MIQDLKALIVVLGLTLPIWLLAKKLVSVPEHARTFELRRNAWLLLTVFAFLSPSIWIYSLLALPVMIHAGNRDPNPAALFVLLYIAVPPASVPLPAVVINELFNISHQRLLSLAVLVPATLRSYKDRSKGMEVNLDKMDLLLIGFLGLSFVSNVPYETPTHSARRLFLIIIDTWILYYVFSRLCKSRLSVADCVCAWLMSGVLLASIAMFESLRSWLLYVPISERWGVPNSFAFLLRGSSLRAQASAGHALSLGYWLAISWGFFLFAGRYFNSKSIRYLTGAVLLGGLLATFSRGPWLTALLVTIVFVLLNPSGAGAATKGICGLTVLVGALLLSPLGDSIIDMMPFIGTVDAYNVEYRKRLFDVSIGAIERSPLFGDPFVMNQLESLRQGQGIIDLMNGYLQIALFNGLVGLSLFGGLLGLALWRVFVIWRQVKAVDGNAALVGSTLAAALLGSMFFIATASYGGTTFLLAGLCASYWHSLKGAPAKGLLLRDDSASPSSALLRR